jgi:thioredoxin-related protein
VNGIEKDLAGKSEVIRLNLLTSVGKELASRFAVTAVPTIVVLDANGEVVYRQAGIPNRKKVVAAASA